MDAEQEAGRSEEAICEWLIAQIESTTYMERLDFIAETIAADRSTNCEYLNDDRLLRLRDSWGRKRKQLEMAYQLPSVQGESTDLS
jgi:hypothetical protein